ncbi:MAG TPA: hypothetical protein VNA04_04110 [Thermoanaerobaculia bacterium]|nr:hypothetical protein [Thermoanaerobaculia bacterium]
MIAAIDPSLNKAWRSIERLAGVGASAGVWRSSLQWGDRVTIVTLNSVYTLITMDDDRFMISGGWFDRHRASPAVVNVAGCTCGGAAINRKLIAAPGLHLELGNRVVTTEIRQVTLERFQRSREIH